MIALPITTKGLRARAERLGGGGSCSGSSAARGLRGEMGGLSLIDDSISGICGSPEQISERHLTQLAASPKDQTVAPMLDLIAEYGERVKRCSSWRPAAGSATRWCRRNRT